MKRKSPRGWFGETGLLVHIEGTTITSLDAKGTTATRFMFVGTIIRGGPYERWTMIQNNTKGTQ